MGDLCDVSGRGDERARALGRSGGEHRGRENLSRSADLADGSSDSEADRRRARRAKKRRSESRSRSSSLFRVASSSAGAANHARLCSYARRKPGRLAAMLLQKMADRVGRDGEHRDWEKTEMPVVAKSYFLRMLVVTYPHMGLRMHRELQTLSTVLDHLAVGEPLMAADMIAQRMKALELAIVEANGWDRAKFLELLEPSDATLLGKDEELLMAKELETRARIKGKGHGSFAADWQQPKGGWKGWTPSEEGGKGAPSEKERR